MKFALVFIALFAVAFAVPVDDSKSATILKSEFDNIGVDGYNFAFESSDGQSRSEQAEVKNAGTDEASISVRGQASWIGEDGQTYSLSYVADENGFQPEGAHIPKP